MKISVESSPLLVKNKTGVDHYTFNLIKAILEVDKVNHYQLVYMAVLGRVKPNLGLSAPNLSERRISYFPGKLYNLFLRTPIGIGIDLLALTKPDIFFFPNFHRWPLLWTRKSVVTIHDLAFIDYPEVIKHKRHELYLKWAVSRSIKRASKVIAVSNYTKKRLIEFYGVDQTKIAVVEPSVDHERFNTSGSDGNQVQIRYGITKPYILYLGTLEPRKNIRRIIESFLLLPEELQNKYQLVLAGGKGWQDAEFYELIDTAPKGRIIVTGYVDDTFIPSIYRGASIFVYPSKYEGWGMQVLEAMSCGVPVITAMNTSLPEAGGEAALYVANPDNAQEISSAIYSIITSPVLAASMKERGLEHASYFSWQNSARKLLTVFQELKAD